MLFFSKKNLLQFTFEKNNLLYKKREKNNLSQGKIPAPPPGYQMVRPLVYDISNVSFKAYALDISLYVHHFSITFQCLATSVQICSI